MLVVDIVDVNGQPLTIGAGRVIIRDAATGTPVALACVTGPRGYEVSSVGAPDFAAALAKVGLPQVKVADGRKLRAQPGIR